MNEAIGQLESTVEYTKSNEEFRTRQALKIRFGDVQLGNMGNVLFSVI